MYFICSGVLQGCPLNYLLFNISADPLVNTLANMDDKDGSMSRWCADDGGTALRSYRQLAVLDAIFKKLSPLTGHFLNTGKIIIIVLADNLFQSAAIIQQYLNEFLQSWAGVHIVSAGIWMGPTAGAKQWLAEIQRCQARLIFIKAAAISPYIAVKAFSSYCLSLFGYPAQFLLPPQACFEREPAYIASLI